MRLDRWLGPCIVLLALVWLWLAYTYIPSARSEGEPGPRAFPVLLGAVLVGLGAMMTVSAFARGTRPETAEDFRPATHREIAVVAATFALLMLYAFLLDKVGFVISTPVIVVLAMRGILRMKRWVLIVSLAAGITFTCWLFFAVLLEAPLPHGSWLWLL